MSPRTPATADEILAALESDNNVLGPRLGDTNAVPWALAVENVREQLQPRTTRTKAIQWLLAAVTAPDSPLIALWASGTCVVMTGDQEGTAVDWAPEVQAALKFNPHSGDRVSVTDSRPYSSQPWVLRRSALPTLREAVERELAERKEEAERLRAEKKAALEAWFVEHHGPALAAIQALVDGVHPPGRGEHLMREALRISDFDMSEIYGTPGSLTIELHGEDIERFADLVRLTHLTSVFAAALRGGSGAPTTELVVMVGRLDPAERNAVLAAAYAVAFAARDRITSPTDTDERTG